jgi:hypothetical protein
MDLAILTQEVIVEDLLVIDIENIVLVQVPSVV